MLRLKGLPEIIGVISGFSTPASTVTDRPSHLLIYKIDGESVYRFGDKEIMLSPETVLYVPEGETYSYRKVSDGDSRYILINFHGEFEGSPTPRLFALPAGGDALQVFRQLERAERTEDLVGHYESLALFYRLLTLLTRSRQTEYVTHEQKKRIEPAVQFLEEHLFDSSLKIAVLPALCGMSAPTFRHIFLSRFKMSPRKYIIRQRLRQAKIILESGEYQTITQVARAVGYEDPLYFSRHFKSVYGCAPSLL